MSSERRQENVAATEQVARAAFAVFGTRRGEMSGDPVVLAAGMSSVAWSAAVGGAEFVVRVPLGDGRRPMPEYTREAALLASLAERGVPVSVPIVVNVEGIECSIASRIVGRQVEPHDWGARLIEQFAQALDAVHSMPPDLSVEADVIRRFHLARIWPFDGTSLDDHPVSTVWPAAPAQLALLRDDLERAARGSLTVVHTDLHPQHVLVDDDGGLAGLLDFGDAFAGVAAWDHACLRYYHGAELQRRVVDAQRSNLAPTDRRIPSDRDVDLLSVAWGLYKLAKTPDRSDVVSRVERLFAEAVSLDIDVRTATS
ncbi:MAG: aminoglycoside phosphotransferase family protein [Ilumatobacter sp.]